MDTGLAFAKDGRAEERARRKRPAERRSEIFVEQIFEHLLATRAGLGIEAGGEGVIRKLRQAQLARGDALAEAGVPATVALFEQALELAIVDRALGNEQAPREHIHTA